jgi:hypothetical protein
VTVRNLVDAILRWKHAPNVILNDGEPSVRDRADALDAQISADRAEIVRLQGEVAGSVIKVKKAETLMNEALAANARLHDQLATARQEGVNEGLERAAKVLDCECGSSCRATCAKIEALAVRALKIAPTTGGENG